MVFRPWRETEGQLEVATHPFEEFHIFRSADQCLAALENDSGDCDAITYAQGRSHLAE